MDTALTDMTTATDRPSAPPAGVEVDPRWLQPPTFEETHGEVIRYHSTPITVIDPDLSHGGQYVAIFEGKPWGYDTDATALRDRVSVEFGIHRDRLFIAYLG